MVIHSSLRGSAQVSYSGHNWRLPLHSTPITYAHVSATTDSPHNVSYLNKDIYRMDPTGVMCHLEAMTRAPSSRLMWFGFPAFFLTLPSCCNASCFSAPCHANTDTILSVFLGTNTHVNLRSGFVQCGYCSQTVTLCFDGTVQGSLALRKKRKLSNSPPAVSMNCHPAATKAFF